MKIITTIAELSHNNRQTIKARVITKSLIKKWKNENGEGFRFYMKLFDGSDKINCVAFYNNYYTCRKIKNGNVYLISNYILKKIDAKYRSNDQYQIVINDCTIIEEYHNDWSIPPMITFNFCPINQVEYKRIHDMIDVLGVVVQTRNVEYVFVKKFMQVRPKKNIFIVDKSQLNTSIRVTLWGEQAEDFNCSNNTILAIKDARVGEYKEQPELTICLSSLIVKNPDLLETYELRQCYNNFEEKYEDYYYEFEDY